ncbi:MAG: ATP-dependent nuclease [Halomonas sp.]|uniref:ATP-dependent nuclease n=1 Tax=Halomonas sp. TaxID=1486246 RepID=UPI003F93A6B8
MRLTKAFIRNFRRLEEVVIDFEDSETVFVGPNNSGKTSATSIFRCFLSSRDFKIHDFSIQRISEIDRYAPEEDDFVFPSIELDLWFEFDPENISFGRAFSLLSSVSIETDEVGIRCKYVVDDISKLWAEYDTIFPSDDDGSRKRSLSHFLGLDGNFKNHFSVQYYSLSRLESDEVEETVLKFSDGKRILNSLVRADFVDAQRNMNDDEEASRSSKLSTAFASFYRNNLDQADISDAAIQIIDENNEKLTEHYDEHFGNLMGVLDGLGVPAAHERRLKIISSISADVALRGSTELIYIDAETAHELPEAYNGLGFKNLVLMAIQIRDFQLQWLQTLENRPLCHLIFIEEPEVHLHAQVQQTFIANIWNILNNLDEDGIGSPQLVITTHSSHVLNSVDFEKVRYFRRCHRLGEDPAVSQILRVSEIHNLRDFQASAVATDDGEVDADAALDFLKRYLALIHCDLFFADAAILIEGTVERLLLPQMITKTSPNLNMKYLTTLEVGGAYAHRFAELMTFLHIPYLVITDIDSVKPPVGGGRAKACCAVDAGAVTSNASLKDMFVGKLSISDFNEIPAQDQSQTDLDRYVAFQRPVEVVFLGEHIMVHGRTLEETFIYENIQAFGEGEAFKSVVLPTVAEELNQSIYELIRESSFKKTDFALTVLSADDWQVPLYIREGLEWLEQRLQSRDQPIEEVVI